MPHLGLLQPLNKKKKREHSWSRSPANKRRDHPHTPNCIPDNSSLTGSDSRNTAQHVPTPESSARTAPAAQHSRSPTSPPACFRDSSACGKPLDTAQVVSSPENTAAPA